MQEEGKNYYTTALKFPDSFAKPSKNVGWSDVPSIFLSLQATKRGGIHDFLIIDNFMIPMKSERVESVTVVRFRHLRF